MIGNIIKESSRREIFVEGWFCILEGCKEPVQSSLIKTILKVWEGNKVCSNFTCIESIVKKGRGDVRNFF